MNEKDFPFTKKEVEEAGKVLLALSDKIDKDTSNLFSDSQRTAIAKVAIDFLRKSHKSYRWDN